MARPLCPFGGGNFGVVISFTFRLHPVSTVMAGPIFYAVEDAHAVMHAYEQFITTAPEDISGFFAFLVVLEAQRTRCR
jgi:FAD/FMN-containing dehydrogenase